MKQKISDCKYNPGVGCQDQSGCERCGWRPETERLRKERTAETQAAEDRRST